MARTAVTEYLNGIENPTRRADGLRMARIMSEVTGWQPQLWGTMVGFGSYHYTYDSGRSGDYFATGFAPRKQNLVVYIMPGYTDFSEFLGRLGKHRTGKSCLYLNKLSDIDESVLRELIRAGLDDLATRWPITPGAPYRP